MKKAAIVTDAQNDYLTDGRYPLWNTDNTVKKLTKSVNNGDLIVFFQYAPRRAPHFLKKKPMIPDLFHQYLNSQKNTVIIQKKHTDSFDETNSGNIPQHNNINETDITGIMTQNCVLFTALSEKARKYNVNIPADCCTSVSPVLHAVAIRGLSGIEKINIV